MGWVGRRRAERVDQVDRAARTGRLADEGWVLPWGLARQGDHGSVAFVPRLEGEGLVNRTGRRWTLVGAVGGPAAAVDPAGLVTPRLGGWSLDWWVGADDRWRLPSREAAVRQSRMGSAPVVETVLRVPGGDAVHRCFGVPGFVVIEVENRSPSPFALALVVRPCDPLGATTVGSVAVEGARVLVDGATAVVLGGHPGRVAMSTAAAGDVADVVLSGGATATGRGVTCADGLASGAVLVPVAHRTTCRAVLPVGDRRAVADGLPAADAAAAVRGWQAQGRAGLRALVPDALLQRAFDTARSDLLLVDRARPGEAEAAALVVAALGRTGRPAEAGDLVRALWSRQRTDGSFDDPGGDGAPGGPHLWALGEHLRLHPEAGLADAPHQSLVAADGWLRRLEGRGALAPQDRRWAAAGRRAAGHAAGEAGLAVAAAALFTGMGGTDPPPATSTAAGALALVGPRRPAPGRPAVAAPAGFDVVATVAAAAAEAGAGDPAALDRLAWLLGAGEPTWAWPDHVHPRTGHGSDGRGHSPAVTAAFVLLVRDLLVAEPARGHATVLPLFPDEWLGQPVEVDDAVLGGGVRLSYAVRWHGDRPALLWEASAPLRLTAPGLDPTFVATDPRGEALLAAPASTAAPGRGTVELS